jgi:hypothetical protein
MMDCMISVSPSADRDVFHMWNENQLQFRFGRMAILKIGKIGNFQNGDGNQTRKIFPNGHLRCNQTQP